MKLQASSLQFYCKRYPRRWRFSVNFVKFLRTPFSKNFFARLLLTLQVHKVDKNMSRYFNKDIKVISIEAVLLTLMSTLKMVLHNEKTSKTTIQKNLPKSKKFARKVSVAEIRYSQTIFLWLTVILLMILMLMVLWNFILKLHIHSPVEQLRWSFFTEHLLT